MQYQSIIFADLWIALQYTCTNPVIVFRLFQENDVVCHSQTSPALFFSQPASVNNSTYNSDVCRPFSTTALNCESDCDNFVFSPDHRSVSAKQRYNLSEPSICSISNTTILVLAKAHSELSKLFSTKPSWMLFEGANSQCYKRLGSKWIFLPVHCYMDQVTIKTNRYLPSILLTMTLS